MARPRMTQFFQRQRDIFFGAFEQIKNDPEIKKLWMDTFELYWEFVMASEDRTAKAEESYITSQKELIQLIEQRIPVFAHMLATKLDRWLPIWFHNQAGVAVPEELIPDRELGHFGPDNPLEIQPDGAARYHESATMRHFQQLRDYNRSFRPSGRVGRPPENIELAQRAYRLNLDGKNNYEIGRTLFPDSNAYDERERDRIRKRVERLIHLGCIEHDRNQ